MASAAPIRAMVNTISAIRARSAVRPARDVDAVEQRARLGRLQHRGLLSGLRPAMGRVLVPID